MATVSDARDLIAAINHHLAEDARQLEMVKEQADSVQAAYADLLTRLRLEIDAVSGGTSGARHLRA